MTAWDALVDDLRRENLDRSYLQATPAPDPLDEVIGILAGLLQNAPHRPRTQRRQHERP